MSPARHNPSPLQGPGPAPIPLAPEPLAPALVARLQAILDHGVASLEIPGANLLVLQDGQECAYLQAGHAVLAAKPPAAFQGSAPRPIQRSDIFRLYSLTKPVTAAAVMALMEDGAIDLFAPVDEFLPGFRHQKVWQDGATTPVPRLLNIQDLLDMTSGLVYGGDHLPGQRTWALLEEANRQLSSPLGIPASGTPRLDTQALANGLGAVPLTFAPGSAWDYGSSADVLGAVVEVASGLPFSRFLETRLFEPLGMADTSFHVPAAKQGRLVTTYERVLDPNDRVVDLIPFTTPHLGVGQAMNRPPAFESGGAGLVSTVDDYARFATMLIQGGAFGSRQILKPATVAYLTGKTLAPGPQSHFERWHSLSGHSYGNLMRVVTQPSRAGMITVLGEYGWDGWLGCYLANIPALRLSIVLMTQAKDSGTLGLTRRLRNVLLSHLLV